MFILFFFYFRYWIKIWFNFYLFLILRKVKIIKDKICIIFIFVDLIFISFLYFTFFIKINKKNKKIKKNISFSYEFCFTFSFLKNKYYIIKKEKIWIRRGPLLPRISGLFLYRWHHDIFLETLQIMFNVSACFSPLHLHLHLCCHRHIPPTSHPQTASQATPKLRQISCQNNTS